MFNISVKIESINRRRRSIGVLHIIAGFYLIAISSTYFSKLEQAHWLKVAPYFLIALASIVFGFVFKRVRNAEKYNYWFRSLQFGSFMGLGIQMLSLASGWTIFSISVWAVLSFYLLVIEKNLFQSTIITLVDEGIKVPGLVRSHILPWDLIENFVVRQDYVTIIRRDKKFVQLEVVQDISSTEIEKLVTFSKQQIALTTAEETV